MAGGRFISPDQLHEEAKKIMLDGRDPKTRNDWMLCANFWARNVAFSEFDILKIMALIYQCPLKVGELEEIAEFQKARKPPEEREE